MIYLSGAVIPYLRHPKLGFLCTPNQWNRLPSDNVILAADNGCYSNPQTYTDVRYLKFLQRMPLDRTLFATAPDVLGSHEQTVDLAIPMLRRIRELGFNAAFVAQDGWIEETTPWAEFDTIFIGGTTEFKFRAGRDAVLAAHRHGKKAHMGRVNGLGRLRAAIGIGCDSADGNCLKFAPKNNWLRVLNWLDTITAQPELRV